MKWLRKTDVSNVNGKSWTSIVRLQFISADGDHVHKAGFVSELCESRAKASSLAASYKFKIRSLYELPKKLWKL